uniref:Uncharacterized protein n=1 Tax=Romanomermis culicivorax TaxID=13658 RepID=A0A915J245_ROMCU
MNNRRGQLSLSSSAFSAASFLELDFRMERLSGNIHDTRKSSHLFDAHYKLMFVLRDEVGMLKDNPPINIEVEDDIDELDAVEVHNDESHVPQEPIKQIAPNTSSYHSPYKYYNTFLHSINQQADDTDKMLLAFSKHFQSIDYLLDPPT